jgi:hypothetical protein
MMSRWQDNGYGSRVRQRSRDIAVASALTVAALTLLGLAFVGERSRPPQHGTMSTEVAHK